MMVELARHIGAVIPTMNRSEFLDRLLAYFVRAGFQGHVYIGDSSQGDHLIRGREAARRFGRSLRVTYVECPGLSEPATTARVLQQVETPYVVWLSDDDFVVPSTVLSCAAWLERHPEYSTAHGTGVVFRLDSSGAHGRVSGVSPYRLRTVAGSSASARLLDYLGQYFVTSFSVRRTAQVQRAYARVPEVPEKGFTELLACCHAAIDGQIGQVEGLSVVRQDHDRRYLLPDVYDWLTDSMWQPSYRVFVDTLADAVARVDRLQREKAEAVVKQAFWRYLANVLGLKWDQRYRSRTIGPWERIRHTARSLPSLRWGWRRLQSFLPGSPSTLSLETLLNSRSTFSREFRLVYEIVTQPAIALEAASHSEPAAAAHGALTEVT